MNSKTLKLFVLGLWIASFLGACASGPFAIRDKNFAASDACNAEGALEFQMVGGDLRATARSGMQVDMLKDGMPSAWCHGLRHVWIGKAAHGGYTFDSAADDPLQFVVDRDKGYYYEKGSGTVTAPDGKVSKLP